VLPKGSANLTYDLATRGYIRWTGVQPSGFGPSAWSCWDSAASWQPVGLQEEVRLSVSGLARPSVEVSMTVTVNVSGSMSPVKTL